MAVFETTAVRSGSVDDNITPEALDWAARRSAPALTIDVESSVGLTREMVDQLLEWANSLPERGQGPTLHTTTVGGSAH